MKLQHKLALPNPGLVGETCCYVLQMLLVTDLPGALDGLVAGTLACPTTDCDGYLAPWGYTKGRCARLAIDRVQTVRARRSRCRSCRGTHVLSDLATYPRRLDTAETLRTALLASAGGLGHRRVAELVDQPPTTARDWIRRARTNAEAVRVDATIALVRFDPNHGFLEPTGSELGDMLNAVGAATSACVRRFGPGPSPWRLAAQLTRTAILAVEPQPRWHRIL